MMKRENRRLKNKWNQTREERQDVSHPHRKELVVESLKLPKDSLLGASIVTLTGNTEVFVENYKGIIEYTREKIRLQTKNCQVTVQGKQLVVEYYTNEEMKIKGFIQGILYDS